jgi:hypothetical protein
VAIWKNLEKFIFECSCVLSVLETAKQKLIKIQDEKNRKMFSVVYRAIKSAIVNSHKDNRHCPMISWKFS